MNKPLSKLEILEIIMSAAEVGISFWRPGDIKEAKHIIGTVAYEIIIEANCEVSTGDLFYLAVKNKQLPLNWAGKCPHNGHNLYQLNS